MGDPRAFIPFSGPVPRESACRRRCWTQGRSLHLADGACWYLPRINLDILVLHPRLVGEIVKTFNFAGDVPLDGMNLTYQTLSTALYHAQLAQLGITLLQINYDLPDESWQLLLNFEWLPAMLKMTFDVSEAIADSINVWIPFYGAMSRGRDYTSLN